MPPLRRLVAVSVVACGVLALLWLAFSARDRKAPPVEASLPALVAEIAADRPGAVESAEAVAARDWPAAAPVVRDMLSHESWRVRAAACRLVARRLDGDWLPALLPRACDSDWHVRMASFTALAQYRAAGPLPPVLRDTPLAEREQWLLAWLDAYDRSAPAPLGPELCEVFASEGRAEFGRPLAARCLGCHAGARPEPVSANDVCGRCHQDVFEDWVGSAHAQSLSHLHLGTVNPATRQPETMDFGEVHGIGCTECHRPSGPPARDVKPGDPRGSECPFPFDAGKLASGAVSAAGQETRRANSSVGEDTHRAAGLPTRRAADSCAACHASTFKEWQAWREGPQPRRAVWPPGEIDREFRGDTRDCIACHMTPRNEDEKPGRREHRWSARRNLTLLRDGIILAAAQPHAGEPRDGVRLVLTNLAGHAYPTGTRRRAVRLHARSDDAAETLAASLVPVRPGVAPAGGQPPLAPGETRAFFVPVPRASASVTWRLVYYRNPADPEAYTAEIRAGEAQPKR